MSTFSIQIDATQLVYHGFLIPIPGEPPDLLDSSTIQTLSLEPGTYHFQIAGSSYADFTFRVTSNGTVDYDATFDTFLEGRGESKLIINGFEVTLDARYLPGSGVLLFLAATSGEDWFTYKTCRMVPATYKVQQAASELTNFPFTLGLDGNFSYKESLYGGFLAGNGTSTLEFLGYPILVDARAAQGEGVQIWAIPGMPFTKTAVQFANLLPPEAEPGSGFALQVKGSAISIARFSLDIYGNFSFDSSLSPYLELQTFNGLTLLKVKAPLPD